MTWAGTTDLLIGDLAVDGIELGRYISDAENEINVVLGRFYELPIPTTLTTHEAALLKLIHSRLASGLFICSQATASESEDLNRWGESLMKMARRELEQIGTVIELSNAVRVAVAGKDMRPAVGTKSGLTESPFDTYERFVHGNDGDAAVDSASWFA